MYDASFVFIFIFHVKYSSCLRGEDAQDVTTGEPMKIHLLDYNDLCKFQPNTYDCGRKGRKLYRYYYDLKLEDCKAVTVGDCDENANVFSDLLQCKDACRDEGQHLASQNLTPNVFCRFQPDFGMCHDYHPLWYFDVSTKTCKGFSYSGCGGNQNKFKAAHDCTGICVPAVSYVKEN